MRQVADVVGRGGTTSNTLIVCLVVRVRYTYDFLVPDKRGNLYKELNVDLRMLSTLKGADQESLKAV